MDKRELRIGNYVYARTGNLSAVRVSAIGFTNCIHGTCKTSYKLISPVKLTPDWLLSFGFVRDELISYRWHINGQGLSYDLDDGGICIAKSWNFQSVKYVHQLQNLYYALEGKELEHTDSNQPGKS